MEQTMGKRIAQNRKRLGLTQDALAEKLGVTAQAVSKWENDQSCPDITMLPQLAQIFGITTDELLGLQEQKVHEGEVVDECGAEEEQEPKHSWEFRWDAGRRDTLMFALFVLLVGGVMLAARLLSWDVSFWEVLWPSALLTIGLQRLLHRFSFFGIGCTLFGGYFLLENIGITKLDLAGELVFPVLVVIFGLSLLADALRKPKKARFHVSRDGVKLCDENGNPKKGKNEYKTDGESFEYDFAFGNGVQKVALPVLSEGEVNMSFGELILDLTGCDEITDGCALEVNCSFGELVILVPKRFRVEPDSSTSFADLSIVGQPDPNPQGIIRLDASVSFGEMIIKYV